MSRDDAQRTEPVHAASPSPPRGLSSSPRLVVERTRVFTSQLDCIIKSKDKPAGKGGGEASPNARLRIKEEVNDNVPLSTDFMETVQVTVETRVPEVPSGWIVETLEPEAPSLSPISDMENVDDSADMKELEDSANSSLSHSLQELIHNSSDEGDLIVSVEVPTKPSKPCMKRRKKDSGTVKEETKEHSKRRGRHSRDSQPKSSPDNHKSRDSKSQHSISSSSPKKRRSKHGRRSERERKSASPSKYHTRDSSRRKSESPGRFKDSPLKEKEKSRSEQIDTSTPIKQESKDKGDTLRSRHSDISHQEGNCPEAAKPGLSSHEDSPYTLRYPVVPHYRQRCLQLYGHDLHSGNLSTNYSTPIKTEKFSNEDKTMGSSLSLSSRSDSGHSRFSTAPDYIPFAGPSTPSVSHRPDTPYSMPTPNTPYSAFSSPNSSFCSSQLLSSPLFRNLGMSPPPPPPLMHQGVFRWSTNTEIVSSPSPRPATPQTPLLFAPSEDVDKRFRCLQALHNPPKPNFQGYQLIGDSMLLRFSQRILNESANFAESLRFLGYCVSGQRIGELLKRLKCGFYHVGKKVILMIGTNDLLKNTHMAQMCHELRRVVEHLREAAEEVVVLTLPPVPRLESSSAHWLRLHQYNDYIKTLTSREPGISVFDLSPLYTLTQEELEEEELLAEFNTRPPFCRGCLTCLEDSEDSEWDSSESDEDGVDEAALLTRVFISTSAPAIAAVDICNLFVDRRIPKCRLDCFEMHFSESGRKDLIHLNFKGLCVVREELFKVL